MKEKQLLEHILASPKLASDIGTAAQALSRCPRESDWRNRRIVGQLRDFIAEAARLAGKPPRELASALTQLVTGTALRLRTSTRKIIVRSDMLTGILYSLGAQAIGIAQDVQKAEFVRTVVMHVPRTRVFGAIRRRGVIATVALRSFAPRARGIARPRPW